MVVQVVLLQLAAATDKLGGIVQEAEEDDS